jgi:mannose-1-phosphate guanylyltransferase
VKQGWTAIILAGGDGARLLDLTRRIAGDDRPKQFCRVIGSQTLLDETRQRVARVIAPARTFFSVTRRHEDYYQPALSGVPRRNIVVQPDNRGTAPAILYALMRLQATMTSAATVILPSDHYVSDDAAFMARVASAVDFVTQRPDLVVLLGMSPDRAETEYGWIEPGDAVPGSTAWPIYRVRRFWEKPAADLARQLIGSGCFWNIFVVVAHPARLRRLIRHSVPALTHAFAPLDAHLDTAREITAARSAYAGIGSVDFSQHVLQPDPSSLAVLPVTGIEWSDLGSPVRVLSTREGLDRAAATA